VFVPEGEYLSASPVLIGEIQAVVRVAVGEPIVEPEALVAEITTGMIIDQVEDNGDAMEVGQVDQAFQLVDPGAQLIQRQLRFLNGSKHRIDRGEISRKIVIIDLIEPFRGEIVDTVITCAVLGREFLDRQQLNGVDSEIAQIAETGDDIEEAAAPRRTDIVAVAIDSPPSADVELIEDQVAEIRRAPIGIVPRVARSLADDAVGGGESRIDAQLPRVGIPLWPGCADTLNPKHVLRAVARTWKESAPGFVAERRQSIVQARRPTGSGGAGQRVAGQQIDALCPRRPGPKGDAACDQSDAHWRGEIDELELDAHPLPLPDRGDVLIALGSHGRV
jgi:hypothetical protein